MKTKYNTISLLIFFCIGLYPLFSYGQNIDSTVSIALSIPHGEQLKTMNDCSSLNNDVFIIIRNNTDSVVRFYENWNSYGYYNFTFEIKTNDSIYTIVRPQKLWYRNFPSHHSVLSHESIVFQFDLIDTACASGRSGSGSIEDGWIGFPDQTDTAQIRVIYSLHSEFESYSDRRFREADYAEYLDDTYEPNETEPNTPVEEHQTRIYIFPKTLISEWKKVIIKGRL